MAFNRTFVIYVLILFIMYTFLLIILSLNIIEKVDIYKFMTSYETSHDSHLGRGKMSSVAIWTFALNLCLSLVSYPFVHQAHRYWYTILARTSVASREQTHSHFWNQPWRATHIGVVSHQLQNLHHIPNQNTVYILERICGTRYSPESLTRLENPGNP